MKSKLVLFISLLQSCLLYATNEDIMFQHLGVKDGLSHNQVTYITKDSRGFMWFATASGLNRYDGYTFRVFRKDNADLLTIPDNHVNHIQEDNNGNLWIHTNRSGYTLYNPEKETFIRDITPVINEWGINGGIARLYIDKEKNIWCYTDSAEAYQYRVSEKKLIRYPVEKNNETLCDISEDEKGILLIYSSGLIECLDRQDNRIISRDYFLTKADGSDHSKYAIFVDKDGDYWVYAKENSGLWIYLKKTNEWKYAENNKKAYYHLSSNIVHDVKQDKNGLIWISTDHGGINLINKKNNSIRYIINNLFDERSIAQNSSNCLYCDDSDIVWVGTYKKGISFYSKSAYKFNIDYLSFFNSVKNFSADVNVINEDKNGNLWLGTNSSGLIFINRKTNEKKIYQHLPEQNSLSSNVIVSMLTSRNGNIWIGTYLGGLNVFDGKQFINYRHDPDNPNSLSNNNVWALAEDDKGLIWIGTLGNGLQCFDPVNKTFKSYGTGTFASEYISSICIGKDKNIYLGTASGLVVYYPLEDKFEKLTGNYKKNQQFSHPSVNQIFEDSRGLLWIATHEGINIYDRKRDEIIRPDAENKLRNQSIFSVTEDNNKNIWITTASGVSNTIIHTDPKTNKYTCSFHHYDEHDGLQSMGFNLRSVLKTSRGEIFIGGLQGINFFDPANLQYNKETPPVIFTNLQLFNKDIQIDSLYNANRILSRSPGFTDKIILDYKQNVLSISFSSLNYTLPKKTTYQYLLDGFNDDWLIAEGNKVTYTNLTPGSYIFKVKARNNDGFANDEISSLSIVIRPPFWATTWAYCLYGLAIILLFTFIFYLLKRRERNKYKLQQIKQEAQQKHEIDEMKLRFFTNISHELRTPLTLIISPLEKLIKTTENNETKDKLLMIHRNSERLLNMVNQLLDFRKSDVKGHQLNLSHGGDIIDFIRSVCKSFTAYSEKKNVYLTFFSAIPELQMDFDEDKVHKIMMNLLSNAFKFTREGGRVDVSLNIITTENGEQLEIQVTDTGIGIADNDKELIFERFYQANRKDSPDYAGSGIGLHLTREFVSLHGGKITVHDNVKQGSVFIVTLPIIHSPIGLNEASDQEEKKEKSLNNDSLPVILIIDDNNDFRHFMKTSLEKDFCVKEAVNGKEAWSKIPDMQPDIIVSDVMMPEIDGIELCNLVKTDIRTSHIPLILLTARSADEQKLEGFENGADDYITKPFNFEILLVRIKKLLSLKKNRQENFKGQMEINPSEIVITSMDEKLISKAIKYVENNISRSDLSVEELSRELGMSRVHLYKKLLSITGKTPIEFIRIIRLKRAAQLLRESQLNVSEIAFQVGFNNPKYFSKYFKEEFNISPSTYQEREKK